MNVINSKFLAALFSLVFVPGVFAWVQFLDGSTVPGAPWLVFAQNSEGQEPGETIVVDFQEGGTNNQALRLNSGSGMGAHEWYLEVFAEEEVVLGARFRMVQFSATGKENIISITTRSKHLAPAPSITLVDGRFKLWTYVDAVVKEQEIKDLGPADTNVFHTVYLFARSDGWVKLWWDGRLAYDNYVPLANPYDGYVEWGSGSWQFDAEDTIDFDWVGYGTQGDLPVSITSTPPHGAIWQNANAGITFNIVSQPGLAPAVAADKVFLSLPGALDPAWSWTISGNGTNRQAQLTGISADRVYKGMLSLVDAAGTTNSLPFEFDTFRTNHFTFEAEDYNFDSGQFLDTIVLSSAAAANNYIDRIGVEGIDHLENSTESAGSPHQYRADSLVGTERTRDILRPKYVAAQEADPAVNDFNVDGVQTNEWLNYTRTFPAGTYNLYGRMATDVGASFTASVSKVTGATTAQQTAAPVGSFRFSGGRGLQTFDYVQLTDAGGTPVPLSLNGQETLRVTATEGAFTANYYMLVPAEVAPPRLVINKSGTGLSISWQGSGFTLERTSDLPANWTAVPNASNPMPLTPDNRSAFYRLRK
jgi:hypothetical protein